MISLVNAPKHENAYTFVYEEVKPKTAVRQLIRSAAISTLKRKNLYDGETTPDFMSGDVKRVKGLGIGSPVGPVSLDDVRRLQRSNEDLRNQLEVHLLTIEKLRAESRAATARHDAEIKELRETLSSSFLDQIQELRAELEKKEKELEVSSSLCSQQQNQLEDRDRSLAAAIQSRKDADEVIKSQRINIDELKEQLEEERNQRRSEREKAEVDLKSAIDRVRSEAAEELKRHSDSAAQQLKEHLEMINKLQEADRENRTLIQALHAKLGHTRELLVEAERMTRTLELRLQEEESCSATARKRIAEKEQELESVTKELQEEKIAKDKALSQLNAMEVEMETATRDLKMEQQRLQGARERIVLRETQLRAFHSTAEEIAILQQKQQEQLKEMMRVLEDGEEEAHIPLVNQSLGLWINRSREQENTQTGEDRHTQAGESEDAVQATEQSMNNESANGKERYNDSDDADSQTTAVNVGMQNHIISDGGDTQMDDDNGFENGSRETKAGFPTGKEMEEARPSAPMRGDAVDQTQVVENDNNNNGSYVNATQDIDNGRDDGGQNKALSVQTQVLDTQNRLVCGRALNETQPLTNGREDNVTESHQLVGGNTQLEVEVHEGCQGDKALQDVGEHDGSTHSVSRAWDINGSATEQSDRNSPHESRAIQPGGSSNVVTGRIGVVTTSADLLTSEAAGSWALSTPASVHCDNAGWSQSQARGEPPQKDGQHNFDPNEVEGNGTKRLRRSVNGPSSLAAWHHKERRDLNVMLDIVAPELSRLHGLDRVMETAPDSEEHTEDDQEEEEEEDEEEEEESSEPDSSGDSEPVSQSVSVSARY
ncbi:hypothetical protein KP509_29G083000 [Ceratopteris richardii]|nr:hypothetical protein KP509_29G083000 [Ceratopteris richardii]